MNRSSPLVTAAPLISLPLILSSRFVSNGDKGFQGELAAEARRALDSRQIVGVPASSPRLSGAKGAAAIRGIRKGPLARGQPPEAASSQQQGTRRSEAGARISRRGSTKSSNGGDESSAATGGLAASLNGLPDMIQVPKVSESRRL